MNPEIKCKNCAHWRDDNLVEAIDGHHFGVCSGMSGPHGRYVWVEGNGEIRTHEGFFCPFFKVTPDSVAVKQEILDLTLRDIGLSVRSRKALGRKKVFTVGELIQCSSSMLLDLRGLGVRSLSEIQNALAQYGITLKGE